MDGMENSIIEPEKSSRQTSSMSIDRLTLFFVIISLLVSTIAIILAATSLSKQGPTINVNSGSDGHSAGGASSKYDDDVWLFAIGHDGSVMEYIDDTTGTLRGFHVDVISAVCAQADKNCRLVWDVYNNCWDSQAGQQARGGQGLMSGWYDGCTGWFNTYERALVFQFTDDLRKPFDGAFYVKQGNPNGFDPTSIGADQQIGFGDGWFTDEYCLARNSDTITGVPLDPSQVVHYPDREGMIAAVNSNEVHAIFTHENDPNGSGLQQVGGTFTNCARGGAAMMSRMHSTLNEWWNPAFEAVRQLGVYKNICAKIDNEHGDQRGLGSDVICLD